MLTKHKQQKRWNPKWGGTFYFCGKAKNTNNCYTFCGVSCLENLFFSLTLTWNPNTIFLTPWWSLKFFFQEDWFPKDQFSIYWKLVNQVSYMVSPLMILCDVQNEKQVEINPHYILVPSWHWVRHAFCFLYNKVH